MNVREMHMRIYNKDNMPQGLEPREQSLRLGLIILLSFTYLEFYIREAPNSNSCNHNTLQNEHHAVRYGELLAKLPPEWLPFW